MKNIFSCIIIFVFICNSQAQKALSPIDIPIYLSGNFGELRTNHFHSGIDFKTQGKIGLPIRAVKNGYISRIFVSPWGYGRALYIDHPDGTTTLYGHLDHFAKEIEAFTVDSQYIKESFYIDMAIPADIFPVKKGQIIAFGGNTGGSAGPHLHFELRETSTQNAHDPLVLYTDLIKDTRKPVIQALMIYPDAGKGLVQGKTGKLPVQIKKDKTGKEILSPGEIEVWGRVGFAIKAVDYMNDTYNTYGVKEVILKIDDQKVFHSDMTHFAFSETRYLNSLVDWEEWTFKKSFYMKSFIEPGNKLEIYRTKEDGFFDFNEEKNYTVQYTLKDRYGNTSTFDFTVKGKQQNIPISQSDGILFSCNQDNLYDQDGISLTIPEGNLYTDISFKPAIIAGQTRFSPLYRLHKPLPLHSYCPLTLSISNDKFPQKEKYGIIAVRDGKRSWIGGTYDNGRISAKIRELGSYTIDIDTVAPVITELNAQSWGKNKRLSFKISDALSGVESWKGTLDGQFILFELDGKNAHLFCNFDPKRMKTGSHRLKLVVRDGCGNESVFDRVISWGN